MVRGVSLGLIAVILAGWGAMGLFSEFQRKMVFPGPEGVSESLLHDVATQVGAAELRIPTEDVRQVRGGPRGIAC